MIADRFYGFCLKAQTAFRAKRNAGGGREAAVGIPIPI
jgi:hypothetical protein